MIERLNVISMSRSGHRAVLDWLRGSLPGSVHTIGRVASNDDCRCADWHLVNYENCSMPEFVKENPPGYSILHIRDYRNWAASMIMNGVNNRDDLDQQIDVWMTHAAAVDKLPTILYHEWTASKVYRDKVLRKISSDVLKFDRTKESTPTRFGNNDFHGRYKGSSAKVKKFIDKRTDAVRLSDKALGFLKSTVKAD